MYVDQACLLRVRFGGDFSTQTHGDPNHETRDHIHIVLNFIVSARKAIGSAASPKMRYRVS